MTIKFDENDEEKVFVFELTVQFQLTEDGDTSLKTTNHRPKQPA